MYAAGGRSPPAAFTARRDPVLSAAPIPIAGAAGDQQAALFGQTCFQPGEAKNTYGTGCFMLMNTGEKPVFSQERAGHDHCLGLERQGQLRAGRLDLRGGRGDPVAAGRAAAHRFRAGLGVLWRSKVPDTNGCYVVPAFTGLGAPHWDQYARGTIVGTDPRRQQVSHHPRDAGHPVPTRPMTFCDAMEADSGIQSGGAEGGRRRLRQQLSHADPGGYYRRAGAAPPLCGDYRHGRGVSGRACGGVLGKQGRRGTELGDRPHLRAEHRGGGAGASAFAAGTRRSSAPTAGRRNRVWNQNRSREPPWRKRPSRPFSGS